MKKPWDKWLTSEPQPWDNVIGTVVEYEQEGVRLVADSLLCRLGLHGWSGWYRRCERTAEQDTVTCHFFQFRRCTRCAIDCGRETFGTWRLSRDQAVRYALLNEDERDDRGLLPGFIDIGKRRDTADCYLDRGANRLTCWLPANWRCRLGVHYFTKRTMSDTPFVFAFGPTHGLHCDRCRRVIVRLSLVDRLARALSRERASMWCVAREMGTSALCWPQGCACDFDE